MKSYILILLSKDIKALSKIIEDVLSNYKEDFKTSTLAFDNISILSFKSNKTLTEIKARIKGGLDKDLPLFFLFDASKQGETFEMNFGKLEPVILLEKEPDQPKQITDGNLDLNGLLDLVFKNGFSSLTEEQKDKLKKLSEE